MERRLITWIPLGIAVLTACGGSNCTEEDVAGLEVVVLSEPTGTDCDATVVATDDSGFREELSCSAVDDGCDCTGLVERSGTYTVEVTLDGEERTQTVTIDHDGCHPIPETLCFFGRCDL